MTENRVVILTRGISGSGKSTWARAQQIAEPGRYKIVEKDLLRFMLDGGRYTRQDEEFICTVRNQIILLALEAGFDVIISDTNLEERHERTLRELVVDKAEVRIQDFTHIPLETLLERSRLRNDPSKGGDEVIIRQYQHYILKEKEEVIV